MLICSWRTTILDLYKQNCFIDIMWNEVLESALIKQKKSQENNKNFVPETTEKSCLITGLGKQ